MDLSSEETTFFQNLWSSLGLSGSPSSVFPPSLAVPFFSKSGVERPVLKEIWSLSCPDGEQMNFLNFSRAIVLVGKSQRGAPLNLLRGEGEVFDAWFEGVKIRMEKKQSFPSAEEDPFAGLDFQSALAAPLASDGFLGGADMLGEWEGCEKDGGFSEFQGVDKSWDPKEAEVFDLGSESMKAPQNVSSGPTSDFYSDFLSFECGADMEKQESVDPFLSCREFEEVEGGGGHVVSGIEEGTEVVPQEFSAEPLAEWGEFTSSVGQGLDTGETREEGGGGGNQALEWESNFGAFEVFKAAEEIPEEDFVPSFELKSGDLFSDPFIPLNESPQETETEDFFGDFESFQKVEGGEESQNPELQDKEERSPRGEEKDWVFESAALSEDIDPGFPPPLPLEGNENPSVGLEVSGLAEDLSLGFRPQPPPMISPFLEEAETFSENVLGLSAELVEWGEGMEGVMGEWTRLRGLRRQRGKAEGEDESHAFKKMKGTCELANILKVFSLALEAVLRGLCVSILKERKKLEEDPFASLEDSKDETLMAPSKKIISTLQSVALNFRTFEKLTTNIFIVSSEPLFSSPNLQLSISPPFPAWCTCWKWKEVLLGCVCRLSPPASCMELPQLLCSSWKQLAESDLEELPESCFALGFR